MVKIKMQKRSVLGFIKNAAGIALVSSLVVASAAIASVTINNVGISGDSSFTNVTGTASMVWDVGSGNTISLNTNNNGPVTLGTGLFSFTTASGTNLGLTGYIYSANASTSNVSSTRIDATTGGTIANVSSTRVTVSTSIDGARADITNVSSTRIDATTGGTIANVSSTNSTVSGAFYLPSGSTPIIAASTTIRTALINATSTSLVTVDNCGTSAAVVGTPFAGLVTVGTGANIPSCRVNYPTSTLQFMNEPACIASYFTATTSLMSPLVASSSKNYLIIASTSSTQQIAQLKISYICVGL